MNKNTNQYEGGEADWEIIDARELNTAAAVLDKAAAEPDIEYEICGYTLQCGHSCLGVSGESCCLPCLNSECIQDAITMNQAVVPHSAADIELCSICYTSELGAEACVRLSCNHVFHANCVAQLLKHGQSTLRMTFGYLDCPGCKAEIQLPYQIPHLSDLLQEHLRKKQKLVNLAIKTAREEGHETSGRVVTEGDAYYGKFEAFALHFCTFYQCFDCQEPYFGGMQDCEQALEAEDKTKKEDLLCRPCSWKSLGLGSDMCNEHGNEFIDFKCMYCCSVGLFVCAKGRYYFCVCCHNDIMSGGKHKAQTQCTGGNDCPLGIPKHPQASDDPKRSAFAIGCSLCRSKKLALVTEREGAFNGVNIEKRDEMKHHSQKGHDLGREMNIAKKPRRAKMSSNKACCIIF